MLDLASSKIFAAHSFRTSIGGVLVVVHLRNLAVRWIELPWEDGRMSPKAWIDYVEIGNWKPRASPRTKKPI